MLKCFAPLKHNLRDRASQRLIGLLLVLGPSLALPSTSLASLTAGLRMASRIIVARSTVCSPT
ncbi:hypothetical protein PS862_00029 [Pseudomonas fluorescens]|uniref:Uncharacterized protein n=1 Tax=Pseudomonas fluorescens TaxID=294 RepID=A0A5E7G9M7_PSEFL|nr:hypothetical protein PS862_00029 [Pseudomonas fluorescens]